MSKYDQDTLLGFFDSFPWSSYSQKMTQRVMASHCVGYFTEQDTRQGDFNLIVSRKGNFLGANAIALYCLLDPNDGMFVDARFQAFAQSAVVAALDAICTLIVGKNYDQVHSISLEDIDQHLKDRGGKHAFSTALHEHVHLALDSLHDVLAQCAYIPLPDGRGTPLCTPESAQEIQDEYGTTVHYPQWYDLKGDEKMRILEKVMDKEVRPFVEMDGGGVSLVKVINDTEVVISYSGACTSCFSATGATLSGIQQLLQVKVHPDLTVTPDFYLADHLER